MEVCAREAHIFHMGRSVKLVKDVRKLPGMAWLNPTLGAFVKEVFQPFMRKTGDHGRSVTDEVTPDKRLTATTVRLLPPPGASQGSRRAQPVPRYVSPTRA